MDAEAKTSVRAIGVRLALYLAAFALSAVLAKFVSTFATADASAAAHTYVALFRNGLLVLLVFASYALLVRRLEKRPAKEINLLRGAPQFAVGALLGIALIAIVAGALWKLGIAQFGPGTGQLEPVKAVVYPTVVGLLEEMLFRVILFGVLEQIIGTARALIVSAVLFGVAHLVNPGVNAFDIAALALGIGVVLPLAYGVTRNIGFPAGIHMGWNFAQAYVFGLSVSGLQESAGLMRTKLTGPDFMTGGAFGIEGSVVSLGVCVVTSVILGIVMVRRRQWRRASSGRSASKLSG